MKEKTIRKMFLSVEDEFYTSLTDLADYKEIINRSKFEEKNLMDSINREQFPLLDEVLSLQNELSSFYVEEAYVKGFTDANKLRDESLSR